MIRKKPGHSPITDSKHRTAGYLLVAEAARKIDVAPSTIYRWVEEEKVEGYREGYRRYVKWDTILQHLGPQAVKVRGLSKKDIFILVSLKPAGH